jgi:RNA polymerase sigma-70 factor (ECF subfamily)
VFVIGGYGYCYGQILAGARGKMGEQLNKNTAQQTGAFRSLYVTFYPKVMTMLTRQRADGRMAAELARETMLSVWRKWDRFSGEQDGIATSIYAIARDVKTDRVSHMPVWQRSHGEIEAQDRPDGLRGREHEADNIADALGTLTPELLQVIQLSFVDGLAPGEIASRLDLPLGTVKSRLRLAFGTVCGSQERGS